MYIYVSGMVYSLFFFKQKTAYEMRISDWSSDVCSSDLETEAELARQQAALAELRDRRDAMQVSLAARRDELGALLRAAYAIGDDAPLKLMLSQDKVAEAARALAYHRYLQRDRMQRIETLRAGLAELERVEREITKRQAALDAAKARQRRQPADIEPDSRASPSTAE